MEHSSRQGIQDIFYETRVLMGRQYSLRRFAGEILGGSVDPVMLGYIEKGERFPTESLVRRIAAIRNQDAHELLALLWRDRMLYAFARELQKVLRAPKAVTDIEGADLSVLISEALAALPDDGSWILLSDWRGLILKPSRQRRTQQTEVPKALADKAEELLIERELVEIEGKHVRRCGRHYTAQSIEELQSLALEFCTLFLKGLLDKLALSEKDTGTYLRNHFLDIDATRLPEFQQRLNQALQALVEEFATDPSSQTHFLNVLVTSTLY